ncbi:MAG: NUMOD3 domain-containing DNA-binding protein [Candidatus Gracilibacteria bacterium]|jgi:5-methylcytosine-specific restriction endonuclease McrA
MKIKKKCGVCSKEFYVRPSIEKIGKGKFCSRKCAYKSIEGNTFSKGHILSKEGLKKIKETRANQIFPEGHYKRISENHKKIGVGKWMLGRKLSKETRLKISENHKGEKTHLWRGGVDTSLYSKIRNSIQSRFWREDVFKRDNYTCTWCGDKRGHNLNADHIKSFALILKENNIKTVEEAIACKELWDINNGRTLCVPCHKKTDNWGYGARKNL